MHIFNNLFNFTSPPLDTTAIAIPVIQPEKKNINSIIEQAKSWPEISTHQFALRFLKAYINNTTFEGSTPQKSIFYWMPLLELWLQEKELLIPINIPKSILQELHQALESYNTQIDYELAEDILKTIRKDLSLRGYAYSCLGYKGGSFNQGHAISLRIDHNPSAKEVTVHFLNLGGGLHDLHLQMIWDPHYSRHHFRSFPITFSEAKFFGKEGIDLFQRQITLRRESSDFNAYSSHDVYCAFYAAGKVSPSFEADLNLRSKKPQISYTCADMAIELVIRDFLIEKKVAKNDISRFFLNEKLYSLLSFYHLEKESQDDWIMLSKGLQEFSLSALKRGEKKYLNEHELELCSDVVNFLTPPPFENVLENPTLEIGTHFDFFDTKPIVENTDIRKLQTLKTETTFHTLTSDSFETLCHRAFEIGNSDLPFHKKSILMHSIYIKLDTRMRAKYPQLKGFSPPFALHFSKLQFSFIPKGEDAVCWSQICSHFDKLKQTHKTTLFAFHEPSRKRCLRKGEKKLTEDENTQDPTASYLKFLRQFGPSHEYPFLWESKLPQDFYYYQYLAQMCWSLYLGGHIVSVGKPLCELEQDTKGDYYISYLETHLNSKWGLSFAPGALFDRKENNQNDLKIQNENQIYCRPLKRIKQDWVRIGLHPSLQITSLIQWVLANLDLVANTTVKEHIEKTLFTADALLIQRLKENPLLKERCRFLVNEGINFHSQNLKELLFFIRIGILIETHIEKAGFQIEKGLLKQYEEILLSRIIKKKDLSTLYSHLLFLYSVDLPSDLLSLKEWVKGGFWINYHPNDDKETPKWLLEGIYYPTGIINKFPQDQQWQSDLSSELSSELSFLHRGQVDHYTFDLENCLVLRNQKEILIPGQQVLWIPRGYEKVFCRSNIRKTFTIEDKEFSYLKTESPNPLFKCLFIKSADENTSNPSTLISNGRINILEVGPSGTTTIIKFLNREPTNFFSRFSRQDEFVVTDENTDTPWALISDGQVHKVDPSGKILPLKLLNAKKTNFFSRLGIKDEDVVCWINNKKQIHSLDILSLKLQFQGENHKGRWVVSSLNYPGFFIASDQTLSSLPTFDGALVLENDAAEKIVIIASNSLSQSDSNFFSQVFLSYQKLQVKVPYFLYRTESLKPESPEGHLFLAHLLASFRNFEEALKILKNWRCHHYCTDFFQSFCFLPDQSPEGLAFYLHLGIAFFQNQTQILQKGFSREKLKSDNPFFTWISDRYCDYLRLAGPVYPKIPEYIRPKPDEELFLLEALEDIDTLPYILAVRKKLVSSKSVLQEKFPISFQLFPKTIYTLNLHYYRVVSGPAFNPHFVRMTLCDIMYHFIELYERAKSGLYILDLFYLARSAHGNDKDEILAYTKLLYIIHKHPEHFPPFTSDELETNSAVFLKIVEIAKTFEKTTPFTESIFIMYWDRKMLTLPEPPKLQPIKWEFSSEHVQRLSFDPQFLEIKPHELQTLKSQIEEKANSIPPDLFKLNLRKKGKNLPLITVEGILTQAAERQNLNILREANPSLSESVIKELIIETLRYHILNCHLKKSKDLALLGTIDPIQNPEFLIFQSRTELIAKRAQLELISWLQNKTNCLFELEAGGGKGTFLIPFLQKQARKKGLTPVSISPPGLYKVDLKKQQIILKKGYGMSLQAFEVALKTETSADDLKQVFEKLEEYLVSDSLKIIPEVYYSIYLKYQLALENGDCEKVRYLSLILHLFEEKCLVLVDEGRVNLSPLMQAKIGIGTKRSLPECDIKIFTLIYKFLVDPESVLSDGRKVLDVAQILQNKQAMMSESEKECVRFFLIQKLVEHPFLNIPQEEQLAIKNWWHNPKALKSKWLEGEEHKKTAKARMIFLARHYFLHFYEFAMQTVGRMNHQKSRDGIEMPAHRRKSSEAYFEEPYIALILTIQGTLQRNPWADLKAIFDDLENVVLPKLTFCSSQLVATPQHLLKGFKDTTVCSAYLGPKEIYGKFEHSKYNSDFIPRVIDVLTEERNSQMINIASFFDPFGLFLKLWKQDSKIFDQLGMIIDVGGMLRDFESIQIAQDFFTFLEDEEVTLSYDGIVFFKEDELMIWFTGGDEPVAIPEGDLVVGLKVLGYQWEDLNLLTFVDPVHAVGFDALQKENARGLLLIGELLTIGDLAQGATRLRGLLHKKASIAAWIIDSRLSAQIEEDMNCVCTPKSLIRWTQKNEIEVQENELISSAYQQIDILVQKPARTALKGTLHDPKAQIKLWQRNYRKGFIKQFINDPLVRFGREESFEKTSVVLARYAQEEYKKYGYQKSWSEAVDLHAALKELILTFQKSIKELATYRVAGEQMQLYCQEEEVEEQQTVTTNGLIPETMLPIDENFSLEELFSANFSTPACKLFNSSFFTENLFLSHKFINTAKASRVSLKQKFLKPSLYFLVAHSQTNFIACVVSDREAAYFQKQLPSCRKGALFTADGALAQNGFPEEVFKKLIGSEWFEDIVCDLAFLVGTIKKGERMNKRVNNCENFQQLWQEIQDAQPKG